MFSVGHCVLKEAEMIRARAIKRIYRPVLSFDKEPTEVIGYTLEDEQGNLKDVEKEQLKRAIRQRQIEVVNITLTKDNRLMFREQRTKKQFKSTITEEMRQEAETYEALTNMIYGGVQCEYRPSERGLILYKVNAREADLEKVLMPLINSYEFISTIDYQIPPEVRVIYDNAFKGLLLRQREADAPLDYTNIEYIGNYGVPSSTGESTRVKFGTSLRYLGDQVANIETDYFIIHNNFKFYQNTIPFGMTIGRLDITKEDCSGIELYNYGAIGELNISKEVKRMTSRIKRTDSGEIVESKKIFVEKLYISEESGITKHNSFNYTNLDPDCIERFKLKELNVPEEIFDDIVNDSLKGLRYDKNAIWNLQHSLNRSLTDNQVIDMYINNIKQIAIAYKRGTGRGLTEQQKKKFIRIINRFEHYKQIEEQS